MTICIGYALPHDEKLQLPQRLLLNLPRVGVEGRRSVAQGLHLLPRVLAQAEWQVSEKALHPDLTLRETLAMLREVEGSPISRFIFGSPCRFIRRLDILVHIIFPELIEKGYPELARYLRATSPRWGRSWRYW